MSFRAHRCHCALFCAATLAVAACNDGPTTPTVGQLRVSVSTTGTDIDPDGYTLTLDGAATIQVWPQALATFDEVAPGEHSITVAGLEPNCSAGPVAPVTVAAGVTANVTLIISCVEAAGGLRVVAPTTGSDADVAYLLYIGQQPPRLLLANDSVEVTPIHAGSYSIGIAGVATNCVVTGAATRTTSVVFGSTKVERFDIACAPRVARLLFSSTRGDTVDPFHSTNDLYTMDPTGANVVRLTTQAAALHGVWSPDGRKIAYHAVAPDGRFDIHVMNADGTNDVQITTDPLDDIYPQWSPDGAQIAFERGQLGFNARAVWVMNADGTGQRAIISGGHPVWSPDGTRLAFDATDETDYIQIYTTRLDGTDVVQLTQRTSSAFSWAAFPRWSPDGRRMLFISARDGAFSDIFVMSADGSGMLNLTRSPGGTANEDATWSPDGQWIAFRSNRNGGNAEIYVMKADGTGVTNISQNIWDDSGTDWYP